MSYFTDTEIKILKRSVQTSASEEERKVIAQEKNSISSVGNTVVTVRPDKPYIPEVEEARSILTHAINNGISVNMITIIINGHVNWTGTKRNLQGKTIKSLVNPGYNYSDNAWSPYLRASKCEVIVSILKEYFPGWEFGLDNPKEESDTQLTKEEPCSTVSKIC